MKPETPALLMRAYVLEVEIDDSRELRLTLPEEIPPGPARIILLWEPATAPSQNVKQLFASVTEGLTEDDLHRPRDYGRETPEWGS